MNLQVPVHGQRVDCIAQCVNPVRGGFDWLRHRQGLRRFGSNFGHARDSEAMGGDGCKANR